MNTQENYMNQNPNSPMYAELDATTRRNFITATYVNLFFGILAFVAASYYLFASGASKVIFGLFQANWWVSIIAVIVFGFISSFFISFTASNTSKTIQYFGLGAFALIQAIFVSPIIYIAALYRPALLAPAAFFTMGFFLLLSGIVYYTGIDFSFMRTFLMFASIASIIAIIVSIITGFNLGIFFTAFLIILACGYILYDTSNVLNNYYSNQPVAAATALLGSIIMLFVNILQFLMQFFDNN